MCAQRSYFGITKLGFLNPWQIFSHIPAKGCKGGWLATTFHKCGWHLYAPVESQPAGSLLSLVLGEGSRSWVTLLLRSFGCFSGKYFLNVQDTEAILLSHTHMHANVCQCLSLGRTHYLVVHIEHGEPAVHGEGRGESEDTRGRPILYLALFVSWSIPANSSISAECSFISEFCFSVRSLGVQKRVVGWLVVYLDKLREHCSQSKCRREQHRCSKTGAGYFSQQRPEELRYCVHCLECPHLTY